jgi:hypothetical protein
VRRPPNPPPPQPAAIEAPPAPTKEEMGDEIDLDSKDGCVPDQNSQIVLTDAGARRDKYAEGMSEDLAYSGVFLNAMGCDATILSILLDGGRIECNEEKLTAALKHVRGKLMQLGFTRMMCAPDGPSVPVTAAASR